MNVRLLEISRPEWLERALADRSMILLDHAHCEKKAAATALNMIFRYGHHADLIVPLSHLAREELLHFEQVVHEIRKRGEEFKKIQPSAYASELMKFVRSKEPERLLDTLMALAMIEARSCERMALLAEHWEEPSLCELYRDLLTSEERHHATCIELARKLFSEKDVDERLNVAMECEAKAILLPPEGDDRPRMHSA